MDPIDAIREAAAARGLRPWTLSRRSGMPLTTWQRILDGEDTTRIHWESVRRCADHLGVRLTAKVPK